MRMSLFLAAALVACSPSQSIKPEPSAEAQQAQGYGCEAVGYDELIVPVLLQEANYDAIVSTCVGRNTWGWIDVSGLLSANSDVDVHVVATSDGSNVGPEVQAPLGPALATPVGGSIYVEPGKHQIELRVYTGGPGAYVHALQGTWIRGEARQEWPTP